MRVLVTGASGLIGGAVAHRLKAGGYEVVALARSDASASTLVARGFAAARGDLADAAGLAEAALGVDAVVHAASTNDRNAGAADKALVHAATEALAGTGKRLIYTSGVLVYGPTGDRPATEESPLAPIDLVGWRPEVEALVSASASAGLHPIIVRPGWVYGHRRGYAMMMVDEAGRDGVVRHVGDGDNRWAAVHVDDLADLYLRALEQAPAGAVFNGVHGRSDKLVDVARAASHAAGAEGRVEPWPLERARRTLSAFADALALDQVVSGEKAKRELGWRPSHDSIVEELRAYA